MMGSGARRMAGEGMGGKSLLPGNCMSVARNLCPSRAMTGDKLHFLSSKVGVDMRGRWCREGGRS